MGINTCVSVVWLHTLHRLWKSWKSNGIICLTFIEQYQMFDTFLWSVTIFPFGINTLIWSQDCAESIVTSLWTGSIWSWNPSRGIDSCFSRSFRPALGPTQLPVQGKLGDSSRIKQLDLEADHSPSCSVKVKKGWCYTVHLPACLLGLCSDNFMFV